MSEPISPSKIEDYHAHIYYDAGTRDRAAEVREDIGSNFAVELGRWHDEPVGPHPQAMYQVKFAPVEFSRIVPWLMLHRRGLEILVHPTLATRTRITRPTRCGLAKKSKLRLEVLRDLPKK